MAGVLSGVVLGWSWVGWPAGVREAAMSGPWSNEAAAEQLRTVVANWYDTAEADPWEQLEQSRRWAVALEQRNEEARRLTFGLLSDSLARTHPNVHTALGRIGALLSEPLEVERP